MNTIICLKDGLFYFLDNEGEWVRNPKLAKSFTWFEARAKRTELRNSVERRCCLICAYPPLFAFGVEVAPSDRKGKS